MSMFCYQCQETAMGTGCTLKGVCGKTSEVANLQDLLLFVVRGIAVYNEHLRKDGHPSEQADKFTYDALFITITNANFDKVAITEKIKEGLKLFFIHTAWILGGAVDSVFHTVDSETGVIIQLIKQWL